MNDVLEPKNIIDCSGIRNSLLDRLQRIELLNGKFKTRSFSNSNPILTRMRASHERLPQLNGTPIMSKSHKSTKSNLIVIGIKSLHDFDNIREIKKTDVSRELEKEQISIPPRIEDQANNEKEKKETKYILHSFKKKMQEKCRLVQILKSTTIAPTKSKSKPHQLNSNIEEKKTETRRSQEGRLLKKFVPYVSAKGLKKGKKIESDDSIKIKRPRKLSKLLRTNSEINKIIESIDPVSYKKYIDYTSMLSLIMASNGLPLSQAKENKVFNVFVGKGNNSGLVKRMLKQRWWWNIVEKRETETNYHMIWTQLKNNEFLDALPTYSNQIQENNISKSEIFSDQNQSIVSDSELMISSANGRRRGRDKEKLTSKVAPSEVTPKAYLRLLGGNYTSIVSQAQLYNSNAISQEERVHNHMEDNFHLSNKKGMFYNLRDYCQAKGEDVFEILPLTFHVEGITDSSFLSFQRYYQDVSSKNSNNIWIIKPGEYTNRGCGITVSSSLEEIKELVGEGGVHVNGKKKTFILQKYIEKPFLYNKRKFDIRCYILLTGINGVLKGYWYQDGYIRTSCKEYSLKNLANRMIHLTNDAVQKHDENYGKFESANKISFSELSKYIDSNVEGKKRRWQNDIYPRIKHLAREAIRSVYGNINPKQRLHCFEIFGLDFMIDDELKPWLIEINTNPCLELCSPLLSRIIPEMLENAFRLAIDPIFPPPEIQAWPPSKRIIIGENPIENNKFEIVFEENSDFEGIKGILAAKGNKHVFDEIREDDDESEINE